MTCAACSSSARGDDLAMLVEPGEPAALRMGNHVIRMLHARGDAHIERRLQRRQPLPRQGGDGDGVQPGGQAVRSSPAGPPCSAPRWSVRRNPAPACAVARHALQHRQHVRALGPRCPDAPHRAHEGSHPPPPPPPAWRGRRRRAGSGNWLMKPTVSDRMTRRPDGSFSPRMVGSSVAKSWSCACTSAPVMALNNVDLPALV